MVLEIESEYGPPGGMEDEFAAQVKETLIGPAYDPGNFPNPATPKPAPKPKRPPPLYRVLLAGEFEEDFSVSRDGSFVAFRSDASDHVSNDTNRSDDVFLRKPDGIIERISVSSEGVEGNAESWAPSISGDGRYVVFLSNATNFDDSTKEEVTNVYLRDNEKKTTTLISDRSEAERPDYACNYAQISDDGKVVAFSCYRSAILPATRNSRRTSFFLNRESGEMSHMKEEDAWSLGTT